MKRIGPFRGIRSSAGIFSPGQEALARKWIRRCYFFGAAAVCLIGLLECVFYFVVQKLGFLMAILRSIQDADHLCAWFPHATM